MEQTTYNILIATGIYPPKIGGPAQYAKNLKEVFENNGHKVRVETFNLENRLPPGIRHIFFFIKILPAILKSDMVCALDTFSVGLPAVFAAWLFGKISVVRVGGDFLWEQYVERTQKKVLLKDFYQTEIKSFSGKERFIFKLTRWTLLKASRVIFSTQWQKDIFVKAYGLLPADISIIENYYGPKESDTHYLSREFVASGRTIALKNNEALQNIFHSITKDSSDVSLFLTTVPFAAFMQKIQTCYAVINVSVSEVSPNLVLDAIRSNKPFIATREIGIYERIKDVGVYVDPLNEAEIKNAVLYLLNAENYEKEKEKIRQFNFIHSWQDIAREFVEIFNSIQK